MKITNGQKNSSKNYTPNISRLSLSRETHVADDGTLRYGRRRRKTYDADMASGARCQRRRRGGGGGGNGSGCATPLLKWKFHDVVGRLNVAGSETTVTQRRGFRRGVGDDVVRVSARKLTASLWWLAVPITSAGGSVRWLCRPLDWLALHSSLRIPKSSMEEATTWDTQCSESSEDQHSSSSLKPKEYQQIATVSVASALQVQLVRAQKRIKELKNEHLLSKKKLKHFLRKFNEERALWKRREHQKVRAAISDLKDELKGERQKCQYINLENYKLLNDLTDAKLLFKQLIQRYEKERKARVLLEDVCNRSVKEIEADKSEIEALKSQCMRIGKEMEEERQMLQVAEVWREERVHMKLVDAKLILEEKCCLLNNLIRDLEIFLRSGSKALAMTNEAKGFGQVVKSMNDQDIKEFSSMPLRSDDAYTVFKDLKGNEAVDEKIDQCLGHSSTSHASDVTIGSPEINGIITSNVRKHQNSSSNFDRTFRFASGRETMTCAEYQHSIYTSTPSERYVNGIHRGKQISNGRTEQEEDADHQSLNSNFSEISSVSMKQPRKIGTSNCELWRSLPTNDDACKTTSGNTSTSNSAQRHNNLQVQWRSPGSRNPHIARAMKGCIEWPRGVQRHGLKTKLLEARLASQRAQLRSILKQRN